MAVRKDGGAGGRTQASGLALVTGASSGFGVDFARQLAARGYGVLLTARRADRLQTLQAELQEQYTGATFAALPCDLQAPDGPQALFEAIEAGGYSVDVLINNAGFGVYKRFLDTDLDRLLGMNDLNVRALTELTWRFGNAMRARGRGHILLVSSIASYQGSPDFAVYAATKSYVSTLGIALSYELARAGVTVTVLEPGPSPTEFGPVSNHGSQSLMHSVANMPPDVVVRAGLDALFAGKSAVVPGWTNYAMTTISRHVPRWLSAWSAEQLTRRW